MEFAYKTMQQRQLYDINSPQIGAILNWIKTEEIAIPEIQRPFVWGKSKVRDLMDSLYRGYPIGYLIIWQNPNVRLKDGTKSTGKKILIDGQQRVTALRAAVLGEEVVNSDYAKERIQIAFNPVLEKFEVQNPAIARDASWIPDIAKVWEDNASQFQILKAYCEKNPSASEEKVEDGIERLRLILYKSIGMIKLEQGLDIETVNVIFVRVNSTGVQLSQADFAMSKIAVHGDFGANLRKLIDYFSHLAVAPEFYTILLQSDAEFKKTGYLENLAWLRHENDDLYDPGYADVLRVAFTSEFDRGRISDLVSLLSGRNFETREFEQEIQDNTFKRLEKSILRFVNESNFKRFLMIIRSAGFVDSHMISSQNSLNAAYILFLKLRSKKVNDALIEKYVRKWFVMSVLTGRYTGSSETAFDEDVKSMSDDFEYYFEGIEKGNLSDAFWNVTLVRALEKATVNTPFLNVFFAAQVKENDRGFLSSDIRVHDLISQRGDKHHIFPKNYLKKRHKTRREYNQIANMAYTQTEINIAIKDRSPKEYLADILEQCDGGEPRYGGITDKDALNKNLTQNCITSDIFEMEIDDYDRFLEGRRVLMARKIKNYFRNL